MAVSGGAAHERWQGRSASYDGNTWTYKREWLVQTTSKSDRENVVSGATGLPGYGDAHPAPIAAPAYAKTINYQQIGNTPLGWHVEVTYTSERNRGDDPSDDEILVSFTSELYQEPVYQDIFGEAIINTAGDYFIDPSPTITKSDLIAQIKANVSSVPTWVIGYQNAVNNSQVTIGGLAVPQGKAQIVRIDIGDRQKRNSTTFYPMTTEVHISRRGFRLHPLNAGFRELNDSDEPVKILGPDGKAPTQPALLNEQGKKIAKPTEEDAIFLDFQVYPELDFSVLPGIS
jgi:hypothetical protein